MDSLVFIFVEKTKTHKKKTQNTPPPLKKTKNKQTKQNTKTIKQTKTTTNKHYLQC
jgi:hypothetical protein